MAKQTLQSEAKTTHSLTPDTSVIPKQPLPVFVFKNGQWNMDNPLALPHMAELFATSNPKLAAHMLTTTLNALPLYHPVDNPYGLTPNMLMHYLIDQAPQSVTETQLVLNMLILHEQSMAYSHKLSNCKYVEQSKIYTMAIERLTKAYAKQATAFAKLRGKTGNVYMQQVNVNEGGQAVVKQGG
jgi:hypothetical protein